MAKNIRFTMLVMILLLLTGCATSSSSEVVDSLVTKAPQLGAATEDGATALPAAKNECAECHKEKEMLIETAEKVEEAAEAESKGVG